MKYTFLAVFGSLILFGAGCLNPVRDQGAASGNPVREPKEAVQETQEVKDVVGVVKSYDLANNSITILFPEGSEDVVRLPANFVATEGQLRMLARVSGMRDRASRLINASTVEIIREPAIHVASPQNDSVVTSPLVVLGFANATERQLYWRLRDHTDQLFAEGFADIADDQDGGFRPFRFEVFLPGLEEQNFSFELYRKDAAGAESASVRLPLSLLTKRRSLFDVYFGKGGKAGCADAFPVSRAVAATASASRAAVSEWFAGPTDEERQQGWKDILPEGTRLLSFRVIDRVAQVEIALPDKVGACEAQGIRSQLEKTLRQFSEVNEVSITGLE